MQEFKTGFRYKCTGDILSNKALCCKKGFIYLYKDNMLVSQSNNEEIYLNDDILNNLDKFELVTSTVNELEDLESEVYDKVNNPYHYASGKIECIDAMESAYGLKAVIYFCMCNAFKYQWRFNKKNKKEDILKCQWYQNKMLELQERLNQDE